MLPPRDLQNRRFQQALYRAYYDAQPSAADWCTRRHTASLNTAIRLVANDKGEVHPPIKKALSITPVEFDIPVQATRGGELTRTFSGPPGIGSSGRGNQIAEMWLMKK